MTADTPQLRRLQRLRRGGRGGSARARRGQLAARGHGDDGLDGAGAGRGLRGRAVPRVFVLGLLGREEPVHQLELVLVGD